MSHGLSSRRLVLFALLGLACNKPSESAEKPGAATPAAQVASPRSVEQLTVRIGYQKIGSPFLLKERADALNKALAAVNAKPEWIEFSAGPPVLEAMRGGAVDVGYVGETPPVFAQAGGVPFVYVAHDPGAPKSEAILVPKGSTITKVSELKGKRVAVNRGSNVHYLLLRALEAEKLTLDDVKVTYLAPADARTAFDSGQVDAWVIWDPFQAAAEIAGARTLRDGEGLVVNQFFYVARRAFAEEHGEIVRTVLSEFEALSQWASGHPEEAAKLLAASSGVSYEALLISEKRHFYGLQPIEKKTITEQQAIVDAFYQAKVIPKSVQISDAVLSRPLYGDAR